ncbi:hypothetical protein BJ878DRAFT_562501 [Calycina marina]|uniref:Uncharacterized protein n=1 Tax=Calycina marina TaxID=1763456 RepID=A0A9P7Z5E5_9HELO|nr:hypothetical protein BJ878DRAFT_562501 [Calycina marina]
MISHSTSKDPAEAYCGRVTGISEDDFLEVTETSDGLKLSKRGWSGEDREKDPDLSRYMEETWAKVSNLVRSIETHGDMVDTTKEELLCNANVEKILGKEIRITASNIKEFQRKISDFIDTTESQDTDGTNYTAWAFTQKVEIWAPLELLKCGIVLIDFSRNRDSNSDWNAVAAEQSKQLNITCVAKVGRAADDENAYDTLSKETCGALQLGVVLSNSFFVVSKMD